MDKDLEKLIDDIFAEAINGNDPGVPRVKQAFKKALITLKITSIETAARLWILNMIATEAIVE